MLARTPGKRDAHPLNAPESSFDDRIIPEHSLDTKRSQTRVLSFTRFDARRAR